MLDVGRTAEEIAVDLNRTHPAIYSRLQRLYRKRARETRLVELGLKVKNEYPLDAIDLRWTLKDIAAKRSWIINEDHLSRLIELGLVEMRDNKPFLTIVGQNTAWDS